MSGLTPIPQRDGPRLHSWVVVDSVEPTTRWVLRVSSATFDEAAKRLALAIAHSEAIAFATPERLVEAQTKGASAFPTLDALLDAIEEGQAPFATKFVSRAPDQSIVDDWTSDLGARLKHAEDLDSSFRRRFAAAKPPLAMYRDDDENTFVLGTWTDAYFKRAAPFAGEASVDRTNCERLQAFLESCHALAKALDGTFELAR